MVPQPLPLFPLDGRDDALGGYGGEPMGLRLRARDTVGPDLAPAATFAEGEGQYQLRSRASEARQDEIVDLRGGTGIELVDDRAAGPGHGDFEQGKSNDGRAYFL